MTSRQIMPNTEFAELGGGQIAYVKPITSEALKKAFPDTPDLEPGLSLWALCGADGTPIMVADNRDVLVQNAWEHELQTVSLH